MKRNLLIGKYLLLLLLFVGCNKEVKIGFLMDESQHGRWVSDKEFFIKSVEELGGTVVFDAAEKDAAKQYEKAQEMLAKGIDVLVLVPSDMNEAAKIVLLAHKKGVRVISYDRLVKNCGVDYYISFDHVHCGELQAQYLTSACPVGNYVLIGGAKNDNNTFLLKLGQLNILQPFVDKGDIKIVYDNYASEWTEDEGYRMMKECLKKTKNIDAVLAANDRLAGGVVKAINEAGITKTVYITGMDGDLEACQRIVADKQSMTVYKPYEAIGTKAAEVAMQIAREDDAPNMYLSVNNGFKQIPAILLPAMIVSKETIDLTVLADGYLKEYNLKALVDK